MGVSIEPGAGSVPGVDGYVTWAVTVTKTAGGSTSSRVLKNVRVDRVPIGSEDPRYAFVAVHTNAI